MTAHGGEPKRREASGDPKLTIKERITAVTGPITRGTTIPIVVHYTDPDGIARKRRTLYRKAKRYQRAGEHEAVLVRLHGAPVWAERYPHTAWTATVWTDGTGKVEAR